MGKIKDLTLKLDGNAQVISVLSKYVEALNKVSRFQVAIEQLTADQIKLVELNALIGKDISSAEKEKNRRRKNLEERVLQVLKIMQAFAYDKKKKKLQELTECLSSDYIRSCPDIELIKSSKKIWLIADKYGKYSQTFINRMKSSLNPDVSKAIIKFEKEYGLTSDMIKNLEEANISFIESMLLYQDEMKEKEKVFKKMKKIYKQTKDLLTNKIDRFAFLFENSYPAFYKEYSQLREKQLQKEKKEAVDLANETLVDMDQMNQPMPKSKAKTHQRPVPEKKEDVV